MRVCPQCDRDFSEGEAFCPFDGARLRSPLTAPPRERADPLIGTLLDGRYRIEKVLGRGGMGTVYAARLTSLEKRVAVKVLRPVQDDDGVALQRFEREARSASRLGNPHIVDIQDFGQAERGLAFLVMELLEGEDLGGLLGRERVLSVAGALHIVTQCCIALGAAHAAGIVHRDLKPENIFLVTRGDDKQFVKIVDFGLAKINDLDMDGDPARKLTKTGMIFGTPQYMSPEQCMGKPTDHRADIYSLGLILYELLTGRVPFDGDTFMGVLNQHMCDPAPPMRTVNPSIQVPPLLEAVVYRCLDKKVANRPQSMGALADELMSALEESGMGALAQRLRPDEPIAEPSAAMNLTKKKIKGGPGSGSFEAARHPSSRPPPSAPPQGAPPSQPPPGLSPSSFPAPMTPMKGMSDPFAATDLAQEAITDARLKQLAAEKAAAAAVPATGPRAPRLDPSGPHPSHIPPPSTPPPAHPGPQAPYPPHPGPQSGYHPRPQRSILEWILFALLLLVLGGVLGYGALLLLG